MKRPLSLIVGGAVGAFLIAAIGVSASNAGLPLLRLAGVQQTHHGDEASGARTEPTESPEPSEKPESSPTSKPKASPTAEPSEQPDEDDMSEASASPSSSDESEGSDD